MHLQRLCCQKKFLNFTCDDLSVFVLLCSCFHRQKSQFNWLINYSEDSMEYCSCAQLIFRNWQQFVITVFSSFLLDAFRQVFVTQTKDYMQFHSWYCLCYWRTSMQLRKTLIWNYLWQAYFILPVIRRWWW